MSIELVLLYNVSSSVTPFSCPQSFPAAGSFQMSQLFTSGGQSIRSFSFNISPSNEYSGLISFRIEWLDLFAVQGTLRGLLQHHSSKASILWFQSSVSLFIRIKKLLLISCNLNSRLEKVMAPHSSTFAWKIPWTEEPGRLQSMGSLGVGHD